MSVTILGKVLFRRDSKANWEYVNPILGDGEMGIDETLRNFKIGDGVSTWTSLPYWISTSITIDKNSDPLLAAGQPATFFLDITDYPEFDSDAEIITLSPDGTGKPVRYFDMPIVSQDTNNNGTGAFTGWNITGHSIDGTTLSDDLIIIISGGSVGAGTVNGVAVGGDLSGSLPNPTVAKFNGKLPSYYLAYANLTGKPTNVSSFTNDIDYATVTQVKVGRNAANFGLTASQSSSFIYNNTGGDNTFTIGAWLNFLSGTGNVIVKVQWYDGHGILQTKTFYESGDVAGTTYGGTNTGYSFDTRSLRAKDATTITVFTIASGSVDYEVGGFINKIVGDGGL